MSDPSKYDSPIRMCWGCGEQFDMTKEGDVISYKDALCGECAKVAPSSKHGEEPEDLPGSER